MEEKVYYVARHLQKGDVSKTVTIPENRKWPLSSILAKRYRFQEFREPEDKKAGKYWKEAVYRRFF